MNNLLGSSTTPTLAYRINQVQQYIALDVGVCSQRLERARSCKVGVTFGSDLPPACTVFATNTHSHRHATPPSSASADICTACLSHHSLSGERTTPLLLLVDQRTGRSQIHSSAAFSPHLSLSLSLSLPCCQSPDLTRPVSIPSSTRSTRLSLRSTSLLVPPHTAGIHGWRRERRQR